MTRYETTLALFNDVLEVAGPDSEIMKERFGIFLTHIVENYQASETTSQELNEYLQTHSGETLTIESFILLSEGARHLAMVGFFLKQYQSLRFSPAIGKWADMFHSVILSQT